MAMDTSSVSYSSSPSSFFYRRAAATTTQSHPSSRPPPPTLDFPSFHSSHQRSPAATATEARAPTTTTQPLKPLFSTSSTVGNPPPPPIPPPPYSSASLNVRSRSLDHRRFPAFSDTSDRAIYISGYGPKVGSGFSGELFANRAGGRTTTTTGGTMAGNRRGGGEVSVVQHYKSNSVERPGVTVVPIRREATLPARQFQTTEWKSSEWTSAGGSADGVGGGAVRIGRFGEGGDNAVGAGSVEFTQRQQQQQQQSGEEQQQQDEHYVFERSAKFGHNRQAWQKPKISLAHREKVVEAPRATAAEYATFQQRGQQRADGEVGTAHQQQHQQHEQHTRKQQHQREYREWHSGGNRRRQQRQTAGGDQHYGTFEEQRNQKQRAAAAATTGAGQQQQQQIVEQTYGTAAGGGGDAYRYRHQQSYQQQGGGGGGHYANGWGGGMHQKHIRRSASAGATGYYGTAGKSNRSSSAAAYYGGPKRYRKIRFCCFNLIWPPWAVEPSGPPRPMYGRSKASGPTTTSPILPLEQHRPPPQAFYDPITTTGAGAPMPPYALDVHQQQQHPAGGPPEQWAYGTRGQQPRGPESSVPPPHEYSTSAPYGQPMREEQQRMGGEGGGGIDMPDSNKQAPGGGRGWPSSRRY